MSQPVVHFEIGCLDQIRTVAFFSDLFGWKMQAAGPATMINTGSSSGIQGHITNLGHVEVDDVQAYLDKVEKLGGKTVVPPVEIPTGTFAWFSDPGGNTIGLWKSK
jgi:predicted enzyme related to lactoylglutathione lyase